uniref:Uncharacterized protein n=1 Tax=Cacopsylla melanoneura TaxID=428564 RepID=A0A8D9FHZ6_9HEMI
MDLKVSHVLFPCLMVVMVQFVQFSHSNSIAWNDINVDGDAWHGIKAFLGKNVCGLSDVCRTTFKTFVANYKQISSDLEAGCQKDDTINLEVCWIRHKPINDKTETRRTVFECQFWSENPTTSRARYAYPPVPS